MSLLCLKYVEVQDEDTYDEDYNGLLETAVYFYSTVQVYFSE